MKRQREASPTTFSQMSDLERVWITRGCAFDIRKIERARLEPRQGEVPDYAPPDLPFPQTASYEVEQPRSWDAGELLGLASLVVSGLVSLSSRSMMWANCLCRSCTEMEYES